MEMLHAESLQMQTSGCVEELATSTAVFSVLNLAQLAKFSQVCSRSCDTARVAITI